MVMRARVSGEAWMVNQANKLNGYDATLCDL